MNDTRLKLHALIVIPTYNERKNVGRLIQCIRDLKLECDILVVDDNSPDGTGEVVTALMKTDKKLFLCTRKAKEGIGSAHQEGIRYAYRHGYRILVTMDCDFTHPPEYLPRFLELVETHHVVIGSRHAMEGSTRDWSPIRKLTNRVGHFLIRFALGLRYDATNAYRAYHLAKLDPLIFESVEAKGYAFFFESLYRLVESKPKIIEIPVHLPVRTEGESKITLKETLLWGRRLLSIVVIRFTSWSRRQKCRAEPLY